jgi:hypothetical protein
VNTNHKKKGIMVRNKQSVKKRLYIYKKEEVIINLIFF